MKGVGGVYTIGKVSVQSMGEMEKDFSPDVIQPFLANIDGRNYKDGSRERISLFHNPHRKSLFSPSEVALTLEYLVGVPSKTASGGSEKKTSSTQ